MVDSRRKGARWEVALTNWFRGQGWQAFRTGPTGQHRGDIDVEGWPVAIEAKNTANMAAGVALGIEQNRLRPDWGAVIWKRPRKPVEQAIVVMELWEYEALIRRLVELSAGSRRVGRH